MSEPKRGVTVFFGEIDLKEVPNNPFHTDTPFGRATIIAIGNVFDERDNLLEALNDKVFAGGET